MKFLLIILLFISGTASAQTTYYIRADSTRLEKIGGNNELILKNGTRSRTGGYLKNTFDGRTGFFYAVDSAYISGGNLVLVRGGGTQNVTVVIPGGSTPGLQDVITQDPVLTQADNTISRVGKDTRLMIQHDFSTSGGGSEPAFWVVQNVSGTAAAGDEEVGRFDLNISGTGTIGSGNSGGVVTSLSIGAGKNIGVYSGFRMAQFTVPATSSVDVFEGVSIDTWGNAGVVTTAYGYFYGGNVNTGAGTIDNNYGLKIDALATGAIKTAAIETVNGDIIFGALPTGASTDSIMTWEAATGIVRKRNVASITGVNIYNSNGTLTGDRTVSAGGNDFQILNTPYFNIGDANTGERLGFGAATTYIYGPTVQGKIGYIQFDLDTLDINPSLGLLKIDTLTFVPGTKALRYNPSTGLVSYADTSTAAGGGTPAGNFGNLQINRNGAFATAASDTITYLAASGLTVLNVMNGNSFLPNVSDGGALGSTSKQFSDLFLAEGGVINWDAGDATLTQAGNVVTLNSAAFTVNDKIRSLSVGGIGTGIEVEASGSANYASIDYLNDLGTRFQTGLYGSTAGNPGAAFFFQAASVPIVFFTNSLNRLDIAGSGVITLSNLAGTGSRTVLADAAGVLSAPVSDRSVKEHIKPIGSAVGVIMRLKPVSFHYKQGWKNYGEGVQLGFIAQDVAEVLPNSAFMNTSEGKLKGMMGYNETDLIPILVAAVQEQQKQINALKREIQKLKKK